MGEFMAYIMGNYGCINGCMIKTDTLNITRDILGIIAEIDEFKGAWRALGTLAPERLSWRVSSRSRQRQIPKMNTYTS